MRTVVVSAILVLSLAGALQAQSPNASVTGRVTDPTKAVVADAKVTLINKGTNLHYQGATNESGSYYVTDLLPGTYRLEVSKIGFKTVIKPDIVLHVQDVLEINFEMTLGSVAESVTVEAGTPSIQLTSSSISEVVNSTTVRELPLNGRSWTDLAILQMGVSAVQIQPDIANGLDRGTRGFGNQLSISGARPGQNNYRLDGVSINDYTNGAPGSVLGGNLGVDAIQEFSVLTSNYSAEYGKTSGGVINAITRSGTNVFHGSVYEYLRNSALDARNFFDSGAIPSFKRNQFGASEGGPIRKDRTFFFADYEGIRQSQGVTTVATVPTSAARAGNLSTGTVTVDPSAQKYLGLFPLPNGPILPGGDLGIFSFAGQQVVNENFVTIRGDHKISEKDNLFLTYMHDGATFTLPDSFDDVLEGNKTYRHVAVLEESHVFNPHLINSFRFGFSREAAAADVGVSAINPLAGDPSLSGTPDGDAARLSITGITPQFQGGVKTLPAYSFDWNSFQEYDDANLTSGNHSLRFGAGVERMQLNTFQTGVRGGKFNFGSLSAFLTNHPSKFSGSFPQTLTPRGIRSTILGFYLQDDWRWRPSLTLNLGVRYEMSTVPSEVQDKLSNLYNITDPAPHLGTPFFQNPTLRNFEPKVGFAWDPFHNGKTAVRGGFGIFDVLPLPYQFYFGLLRSAPFYQEGAIGKKLPAGSFYAGAFPLLGPNTLRLNHIEPAPPRNYVEQWNLNVQRELTPNSTVMIAYVGSHGVHQSFRVNDMDIVMPMLTPQGYLWPNPVGSGTKINPNFGEVAGNMYGGSSFYDALEAGVQKRMSHGIQFQTSFTWSKSIDTGSSAVVADGFSNDIGSPLWFDPKLNRGLSDFNIGRTLIINGTWQVPEPKSSLSEPLDWLARGWQLGAIYKLSDGTPFSATFGTNGDPLGLNSNDPWDVPNRLAGPGCSSLVNPGNPNNYIKTQCFAIPSAPNMAYWTANCDPQPLGPGTPLVPFPQCFNLRGNAGRNILIGPGTSNLDFSAFKNNHIKRFSENFNVQFRVEVFNILNRPNFAVPVTPDHTDIFDSTGVSTGVAGLLSSTTTTARQIQLALKVVW
jgi:hypothetical protein